MRKGPLPVLNEDQEWSLAEHVEKMAEYGNSYSRKEVIDLATDYAVNLGLQTRDRPLGRSWFNSYLKQWPTLAH